MRSCLIPQKTWGIIIILASLLQGCGHKGPLKLPQPPAQASQPQAAQSQTASPQTAGSQEPGLPSAQQSK
jgi:predicted small lipoprotein YifL